MAGCGDKGPGCSAPEVAAPRDPVRGGCQGKVGLSLICSVHWLKRSLFPSLTPGKGGFITLAHVSMTASSYWRPPKTEGAPIVDLHDWAPIRPHLCECQ